MIAKNHFFIKKKCTLESFLIADLEAQDESYEKNSSQIR